MQLNLIEQKLGEENSLIQEAKNNISHAITDLRNLAKVCKVLKGMGAQFLSAYHTMRLKVKPAKRKV